MLLILTTSYQMLLSEKNTSDIYTWETSFCVQDPTNATNRKR